jgi:hypothetical protein
MRKHAVANQKGVLLEVYLTVHKQSCSILSIDPASRLKCSLCFPPLAKTAGQKLFCQQNHKSKVVPPLQDMQAVNTHSDSHTLMVRATLCPAKDGLLLLCTQAGGVSLRLESIPELA